LIQNIIKCLQGEVCVSPLRISRYQPTQHLSLQHRTADSAIFQIAF